MMKFVGGLLMVVSLPVLADGQAVIQEKAPGTNMQSEIDISWSGENQRFDYPDQDGYTLVRDDKGYMVSELDGQKMIMGFSMQEAAASDDVSVNVTGARSLEALEATGETETVAGIEGEVYRIQWTDHGGNAHDETIVLSDNTLARELLNAYHNHQKVLFGPDPISQAVEERDMGMLRNGDSFLIVSVSDAAPDTSHFSLPKNATTIGE